MNRNHIRIGIVGMDDGIPVSPVTEVRLPCFRMDRSRQEYAPAKQYAILSLNGIILT